MKKTITLAAVAALAAAGFALTGCGPEEESAVKSQKDQRTTSAPKGEATRTVAQEQAIKSAESYLDMTGFSRAGLLDQLTSQAGENFKEADAKFAVDHIDADWNAEAVESAEAYLKMGGFSRASLIEQLTSPVGEQFTKAQATYAVNKVGL